MLTLVISQLYRDSFSAIIRNPMHLHQDSSGFSRQPRVVLLLNVAFQHVVWLPAFFGEVRCRVLNPYL